MNTNDFSKTYKETFDMLKLKTQKRSIFQQLNINFPIKKRIRGVSKRHTERKHKMFM